MTVRANIAWYALPQLVSRGTVLLLLPVYTRVLPPDQMGVALAAAAVASLGGFVVAPGIESLYLRLAYRRAGREEMGTAVVIHLALVGLGVSVLGALAVPIGALLLPGVPLWPFYYLVVVDLALASLAAPVMAGWRAEQRVHWIGLVQSLQLVTSVAVTLSTLLLLEWGAVSILLGDVAADVLLLPLGVSRFVRALRAGWSRDALRTVAPVAAVGLPVTLAGYVLFSVDRIVLLRAAGPSEVGLYGVAYQIGAAMFAVAIILNKEWRPLVFAFTGEQAEQGEDILQRLWSRSLCLVLVAGAVIALFAEEIVRWGLGPRYLPSAPLVPWIVLMTVLRIPRAFLVSLSLALGEARDLTLASLLVAVTFTLANLLLVPALGALGAAVAGIVAYTLEFAFLFSRRWNCFGLTRAVTVAGTLLAAALALTLATPGTVASRVVGALVGAVLVHQAWTYWRFLGTIRSVTVWP